ncbi:MAG: hypothetical protein S4CHLAM102_01290 [Chlamydiia bacterium]|nr:hypothetical protein [Chlamydiia bacterium]
MVADQKKLEVCHKNPWIQILFKPKETIQCIVDENPKKQFLALAAINGFLAAVNYAQFLNAGRAMGVQTVLLFAFVSALPLGALVLTFYSYLIFWMGKLLEGKASYLNVRAAVSWSSVPQIGVAVGWIATMFLHGQAAFIYGLVGDKVSEGSMLMGSTIYTVHTGLGIWSFWLLISTLAQVQGYSRVQGFFNVIFAYLSTMLLGVGGYMIVQAIRMHYGTVAQIGHIIFHLF